MKSKALFGILLLIFISSTIIVAFAQAQSKRAPGAVKPAPLDTVIEGAKREGKVVVIDSTPEDEFRKVLDAFQSKYPFVKAQQLNLGSADVDTRIMQESEARIKTADVAISSAAAAYTLADRGFLQSVDWASLGVPSETILNAHQVKVVAVITVLLYNTNQVRPDQVPATWENLLDPKWKGNIAVPVTGSMGADLAIVWGENRATDYWSKLIKNGVSVITAPKIGTMIAAGEMALGIARIHQARIEMSRGAPVKYKILEPSPSPLLTARVPTYAANPSAGKLFITWLTTNEGAQAYEKAAGRGNPWIKATQTAQEVKGVKLALWDGNPATKTERLRLEDKFLELSQKK